MAAVVVKLIPKLGVEFLPYMDNGVIWVRANFPEGMSLRPSSVHGRRIREIVREFPDVRFISVQAGRNDSGTDPLPLSVGDRVAWLGSSKTWTANEVFIDH